VIAALWPRGEVYLLILRELRARGLKCFALELNCDLSGPANYERGSGIGE
jgi:hypothetical protein